MSTATPQIDGPDALIKWVEISLFFSSVYDKIANSEVAQVAAAKASAQLGDAIGPHDIIEAIGIVGRRKNHDLDEYKFI